MKRFSTFIALLLFAVTAVLADGPFRNHRYDSFKVLSVTGDNIVFIGNSITDMHCWPEAFKTSTGEYLPIVNRGNSGTYSTEQSDNLESYINGKPKKVFMMIGTNDIATSGGLNFSPEQVLAYVKSIVKRIHARSPQTKVYLYSILKNKTGNRVEATWLKANELTKAYASDTENVTYIDLYDKLANVANGGAWSYDNLHLTAGAYQAWCETICEHLAEGETYTVSPVYPENTLTVQNRGGLSNASHGMRATYFSCLPIKSNDVLVFGDSFIKNGEWQEFLGNRNVKNRGTGWGNSGEISTTSGIVDATFATIEGVEKTAPKAIFLYTGTADCTGSTDIATVKTNYKALVDKIAGKAPSSKIYLMAICPRNNVNHNTRIAELNAYMESIATGNIRFVDTYTPMLNGEAVNSKYVFSNDYIGGLAYVKIANLMKDALLADFPSDTYNVTSEADAETRYAQAGLRNQLTQVIARGFVAERGDAAGQYNAAKMAAFDTKVADANALLEKTNITQDEVTAFAGELNTILNGALSMPTNSTEGNEVWYQLYTPNRSNKYLTSNGAGAGVTGNDKHNYATGMWKFVARQDGKVDIINRNDNSYLAPTAAYNNQITTSATQPTNGWTLSYANTPGLFIISSGTVQLNQTTDAHNFKVYNWSAGQSGTDRGDAGGQYMITLVEGVPDEMPDPSVQTLTLTPTEFQKANGKSTWTYHGTTTSGGWYGKFVTGTTPALTVESTDNAANNIGWSNNQPWLKTGYTYNLSLPEDYLIIGYELTTKQVWSFTGGTFTYTTAEGTATSAPQNDTEQTVSASGLSTSSITLKVGEGTDGEKGILITKLVIHYKEVLPTLTYTIDKENGNLYKDNGTSANQNWNSAWRSNAEPQLVFSCPANNMNWVDNNVQMMSGQAGSATYTITAPEGYVIGNYSFTFANNNHDTGLTLAMTGGTTYTTTRAAQTISAKNQELNSMSFVLSGTNGKGVILTDFTVTFVDPANVGKEDVEDDEEEEVIPPTDITYTIDKNNGSLFRDNDEENAAWNHVWKSNEEPVLQFGCGPNNMNWAGNNVQLMTGGSSCRYTLTAPAGYVIYEYSFTYTNNGHDNAQEIVMDNGDVYTTSTTPKTVSAQKQYLTSLYFDLKGPNSKGVVLSNFVVKVKRDVAELPIISTDGDEHWYYITSASTQSYCAGKVIYYDSEAQKLRFGDKTFSGNYIWSFWEQNGKLAIKNYNGEYFGTAGSGTGNGTAFGVVNEPNYIYNINEAYDYFVIKDDGTELHAQNDNKVIVRWPAAEGGASLWKFIELDVTNANANVASTVVQQGKVSTGIGNVDQAIIRSTIRVSGLQGKVNFQGVKGAFSGTNKADVKNVKAYFATNDRELFVDAAKKMTWREENGEQFGATVTLADDGTFSITGTKEMTPGNYYLWIAYDIAETAKEGNLVDAQITSYTVDGTEIAEANGNPKHSVTIFLSEGSVLMPMDKGSLHYRIPAITVTKDGKRLVVLTDDRKQSQADLPNHCYVVAQYSDDMGKTWSDPLTVAGTAETGGNYGHGDASIVTNRDNGDIIGIVTSAGTYGHGFFQGTAAEPPRWKTITSHDGGETWEAPVDHTDDLFGANCDNPDTKTWKSGFSGSGAALQKRDGTLVSNFVNRQADDSQHFYFFMSKDGGKNWYVSGTSGTASADEPKSLERNNGDLAISVRATGYNYHNVTSNDGATWHYDSQTRFNTGITGNACDGEYMVWCSTLEGNPWNIALQTLPNSSSRENVSIALSTDEGETFGAPKTICPRGSCYSATVVLPDGTLGVYYEENGVSNAFVMRFVRFSLDWASNGVYKFTQETPFKPIASTAATNAKVESTISAQGIGTFYANAATFIPEGVKAYVALEEPVMDESDGQGNAVGTISMAEVTDIIPAKTGVVLRGEAGTYDFFYTAEDGAADTDANLLVGYAGAAEFRAVSLLDNVNTYVLTVKDGAAGFYKKDAAFKVYNHKAYLNVPENAAGTLRLRFVDADGTTEIRDVLLEQGETGEIYDLTGRRVRHAGKGVYIMGGKKVLR
ncbi:MAG: exo-alpha-sialidase [Bacteroidaceae bacterium]|nr:exo-alpha-sialidase [Bacteroidaceae bacterium]